MNPESTPPSPPLGRRLHPLAGGVLFCLPFVLLAVYFFGSSKVNEKLTREAEIAAAHGPHDGAKLYLKHCAYCHGERGDGRGVAQLSYPARYFGYEKYRFSCTDNAMPTDDDLLHLLKHGIAGSAMPSFEQLEEAEMLAIIGHIRQLTRKGLYERLYQDALDKYDEGGDDPDPTLIAANVERRCSIGQPISTPQEFPQPTEASLANGKRVFQLSCASCHGLEGRGDGQQTKDPKFVNENGSKAFPRDLTSGMYKGGGDHAKLYARIMLGIPGTPMPASNLLPQQDILDLVNYIKSLPGQQLDITVSSSR